MDDDDLLSEIIPEFWSPDPIEAIRVVRAMWLSSGLVYRGQTDRLPWSPELVTVAKHFCYPVAEFGMRDLRNCLCGLYAWKLNQVEAAFNNHIFGACPCQAHSSDVAVFRVKLQGEVVEHEYGYRATRIADPTLVAYIPFTDRTYASDHHARAKALTTISAIEKGLEHGPDREAIAEDQRRARADREAREGGVARTHPRQGTRPSLKIRFTGTERRISPDWGVPMSLSSAPSWEMEEFSVEEFSVYRVTVVDAPDRWMRYMGRAVREWAYSSSRDQDQDGIISVSAGCRTLVVKVKGADSPATQQRVIELLEEVFALRDFYQEQSDRWRAQELAYRP